MKRISVFVLIITVSMLAIILYGISITASAEEIIDSGTCGSNLRWTLDADGTLSISGEGEMNDAPFGNFSYNYEFRGGVKNIVIGNGVTSIGPNAFIGFSIDKLQISNSVLEIGDNAFRYATINEIIYDEGCQLKSINDLAFQESWIQKIEIPETVTQIGHRAFADCFHLESVTFLGESKLEKLDGSAFRGCSSLESIVIPPNVQEIGQSAFKYCSSLKTVILGENSKLKTIGNMAFESCSSLVSIELPPLLIDIQFNAFYSCYKLIEVVNNSSLNICLGSSNNGYVAYYAQDVHAGESTLSTVDDFWFITLNGNHHLIGYEGDKQYLKLPNDYNGEKYEIGNRAFMYCDNIKEIEFSSNMLKLSNSLVKVSVTLLLSLIAVSLLSIYISLSALNYINNNRAQIIAVHII